MIPKRENPILYKATLGHMSQAIKTVDDAWMRHSHERSNSTNVPIVDESRVAIQTITDGFYSPLEGQRDIRLLEVLPGDDASIVVTTMITVSLDSEPTYAALSYAWGDATQRSIIECNGKPISITASLAEALKAFRSFSAGLDAPLKRFQK